MASDGQAVQKAKEARDAAAAALMAAAKAWAVRQADHVEAWVLSQGKATVVSQAEVTEANQEAVARLRATTEDIAQRASQSFKDWGRAVDLSGALEASKQRGATYRALLGPFMLEFAKLFRGAGYSSNDRGMRDWGGSSDRWEFYFEGHPGGGRTPDVGPEFTSERELADAGKAYVEANRDLESAMTAVREAKANELWGD